jgi:pimeloyl-ACP methyl ester carboxylesterase
MNEKQTIVLIHGLWMTPRSWEKWIPHYEAKGYDVIAPAWPGLESEVEALNEDPTPLEGLGIETIVDHYESIIKELDAPPIIMGHSFGGAFTQILVSRGLGSAGVGIASGTVKGVPDLPLSTIKATTPVLKNPFGRKNATALDEKQFHYAFANTLSEDESKAIYERYAVPAANQVLFEGAFANFHRHPPTEVDFEKQDRAPLLFIAFEDDHIIPPSAARHNYEKYSSPPVVAYKEYPGRPHFPGVERWEAVADFALDWAEDPQPVE